jgi:hypothetical protein
MMAVTTAPIAYSHPKSINHISTPQYRSTCQNNAKVKIGTKMKTYPIHELSLGYGRAFRTSRSVAPQTNIPRFKNVRKLVDIEK